MFPLCALFGGLVALLFHWQHWREGICIAVFSLFPIVGAIKTRQRALLMGLVAGLIAAIGFYLAVRPAHASPPSQTLQGFVICVDPGHTSETSAGTQSRDGKLTERHVNWVVALRLRELLRQQGATVVMTKDREGQVVTNRRRAETANNAHADLLLRLHCDAGAASGLGTYYPDRQGTVQGHTGPTANVIAASRRAAQIFHPAVISALAGALPNRGIHGDSQTFVGGKQGALTGSIFSDVPALTVEMCVLTNAYDYGFIRTQTGQERIAQVLLAGIEAYAHRGPHHPPVDASQGQSCVVAPLRT